MVKSLLSLINKIGLYFCIDRPIDGDKMFTIGLLENDFVVPGI